MCTPPPLLFCRDRRDRWDSPSCENERDSWLGDSVHAGCGGGTPGTAFSGEAVYGVPPGAERPPNVSSLFSFSKKKKGVSLVSLPFLLQGIIQWRRENLHILTEYGRIETSFVSAPRFRDNTSLCVPKGAFLTRGSFEAEYHSDVAFPRVVHPLI